MNFRINNQKKAALLAALLGGCLLGQTAFAQTYTEMITGGEDPAYAEAGIKDGQRYTFTGDNCIEIAADAANNSFARDLSAGVSIKKNGEFVVDGGRNLAIKVKGDNQFNKGLFIDIAGGFGAKKLTVNGAQVDMEVDGGKAHGIATFARNSHIVVNAPVRMDIGGTTESFGIKAIGDSVIDIANPIIISTNPAAKNTASLYATDSGAVINVNYKDGGVLYPGMPVNLDGDIYTLSSKEESWGDDDNPEEGWEGSTINLALSGDASDFRGVSGYKKDSVEEDDGMGGDTTTHIRYGKTNIILEKGALWINQRTENNDGSEWTGFKGSHVTTLTGGMTAEDAGNLQQVDKVLL